MDLYFDLDGTLTDPFDGITLSILYALEKSGLPTPAAETLGWAIGPALIDSFTKLGAPDPQQALTFYRERYTQTGLFENKLYPDVLRVLAELQADGHRMFLMTAKPHAYATRITAHFGIAPFMAQEFGPELDGTRNNKAELLAWALVQTRSDPARSVMIGDRHHDFTAAKANGMPAIAARWGYGTPEEHAQANHSCDSMIELRSLITGLVK
jgi:phosphoglycolate phosphatase